MKIIVTILFIASTMVGNMVLAQTAAPKTDSPMDVFRAWEGHWQGEGSIQRGPRQPEKSFVNEYITRKLNGTIVVVEGIGTKTGITSNKDTVVHHAFGVINFDQASNTYKFQTYLADGRTSSAWFNVEGAGKYQWGFDVPNGKIRYTITIDTEKKTWFEIGEFTTDGNRWMKFFEMNLKKV
ncbi:MAG TPA: hypothetical protein VKZ68_00635 [Ohtaekwangia sp.]|nr:hypothetical protein [Ohtaekwangia sp.]